MMILRNSFIQARVDLPTSALLGWSTIIFNPFENKKKSPRTNGSLTRLKKKNPFDLTEDRRWNSVKLFKYLSRYYQPKGFTGPFFKY